MTSLSSSQFEQIADLAHRNWGLALTERKRSLVSNRLARHLRRSRFGSVDEYLEFLDSEATADDLLEFFDLLSTNVTRFFREYEHFNHLERELYTPLSRGNLTMPGRRLRIWSAACSNGAEPYSIVMHAMEHLAPFADWDFRVLATDLSNTALGQCRRATYPEDQVEDIPRELVRRHFLRGRGEAAGQVRVAPHVRRCVAIARLNLMEKWPMKGPFDVIFCRNVMIYFDGPTKAGIVNRMHDLLRPGGILIIGSAETLSGLGTSYRSVGPTIYQK